MADEEGAAPTETPENVEEPAATPADAQEAPAEATPDDEAAPEDAPAAEEGAEPAAPAETDAGAGTPKPEGEAPPQDAEESGDAEAPKEEGEEIAPVDEEVKEDGTEEAAGEPVEGSGDAGTPGDKAPEAEAEDGGEGEQPPAEQDVDGEAKEGGTADAAEKEATPLPPGEDDKPEEATEDDQVPVGSPPPDEGATEDTDMFEPGTPPHEPESVMLLEEAEEEEVIPEYNREELIEKYHSALQEREILNQKNHQLQHKLAEYFKRKKTEDTRQEVDRNVTDQEQRYLKYMSNLEELRQQEAAERDHYNEHIEEMKDRKAAKQALVEQEWGQYSDFKRSVALASVNSRTGRTLTAKEFEIYELNEVKKEAEVSQVRLENIKLRNRLRKRELQLKQKEELAEGLHLIDFEQLKIENQTYNEKIEERNEELMKLRKKITSTVQVLTHLKEKLQFVQAENHVAKQELGQIEAEVAGKRDILSRTKQARDALRHDNGKLQQKCGLLGNHLLLRDYEDSTDDIDDLRHRLDHLKRSHAELTLSISGVKKKIEQARAQNQS